MSFKEIFLLIIWLTELSQKAGGKIWLPKRVINIADGWHYAYIIRVDHKNSKLYFEFALSKDTVITIAVNLQYNSSVHERLREEFGTVLDEKLLVGRIVKIKTFTKEYENRPVTFLNDIQFIDDDEIERLSSEAESNLNEETD